MGKKEKAICQTCDKEFSYYRSTLRGQDAKYCSHKCQPPWNKGMIEYGECEGCGKEIRAFRKYCSHKCYVENNDLYERLPKYRGKSHHSWKGGPSTKSEKIRKSVEYKLWRKAVFERDDYTCQICEIRGCELNADHIKPFSLYPELRLAIDNGRTLCKPCHIKYGWKKRKGN